MGGWSIVFLAGLWFFLVAVGIAQLLDAYFTVSMLFGGCD